MKSPTIERALLSVSDKKGLDSFARGLAELGIELYSTGGTRSFLEQQGLRVRDVSEYTGFPEIMDGRVKTLHPKVFGGILCRHDRADDLEAVAEHEIQRFELVVVNLYPFEETIAQPGVTEADAIEKIDIGGPSLVRAAAKNSQFVTVATASHQYEEILQELRANRCTSSSLRRQLMVQAFEHTARYDCLIAKYFARRQSQDQLSGEIQLSLTKITDLRYGENNHQQAALYSTSQTHSGLVSATQLQGKELSYNNYLDMDAAMRIVSSVSEPMCVVIKHTNPCGAACGNSLSDSCQKAMAGDPVSAFGSVIGFNRSVDAPTAEFLADGDFFVEVMLAPGFDPAAFEILTTRPKWSKNVRLVQCSMSPPQETTLALRQIQGGLLVQQSDTVACDPKQWQVVAGEVTPTQMQQLMFAWQMVAFVKSNAIVLVQDLSLCGVGAGQTSRVDSVRIAIEKAGARSVGSVMASDAFFPFADSIEVAARAGIVGIVQPGGSVRDREVVEACQKHQIALALTGTRHFLH